MIDATAADSGLVPPQNCGQGADQIALLGFDLGRAVLYRFNPSTLGLTDAGVLSGCPSGTGFSGRNPWSAALDRSGMLWAHYFEWNNATQTTSYDRLFKIDGTTATCTDTGKTFPRPHGKFFEWGLTFVRDPLDLDSDQLVGSALQHPNFTVGQELHRIDQMSLAAEQLGTLPGTGLAYLTGTGDGRLFTMTGAGAPTGVRQLALDTGATIADFSITGLPSAGGAFAFWGGDLWVFSISQYSASDLETEVYRVDLTAGVATKVSTLDFAVTSATASTCAPIILRAPAS